MIQAIIFDFDMTLVDSLDVGNKSIEDMRKNNHLQINLTEKEIWGTAHIPLMKKIAEMNEGHSWEEIMNLDQEYMKKNYSNCVLKEIESLLKIKEKGIYFGIVSNNNSEVILSVLSKEDNSKIKFQDIITNKKDQEHLSKDKMIEIILEKYSFNREKVMYIGDSKDDIYSAIKAKVIPVGITTGLNSTEELNQAGAKIILNNLKELEEYIE